MATKFSFTTFQGRINCTTPYTAVGQRYTRNEMLNVVLSDTLLAALVNAAKTTIPVEKSGMTADRIDITGETGSRVSARVILSDTDAVIGKVSDVARGDILLPDQVTTDLEAAIAAAVAQREAR